MRRYLAFGGEYEVKHHHRDFLGDFDELVMAKAAVEVMDPEGFPTHIQGNVLDTKTGNVHEWEAHHSAFGRIQWRGPRCLC
jgi:hypothetical protein